MTSHPPDRQGRGSSPPASLPPERRHDVDAERAAVVAGTTPSLLALSRAEQERAKGWFVRSRLAHVLTLALTLPALFLDGKWAYFLALGAVASEVVAWTYRILADRRHSLAEEGRRRALLAEGLGTATDELALRDLRLRFSKKAEQTAPAFEDENYYASNEPPGPARLRAAMQESAFWSRHLYGAAAKAAGFGAGVLLVLVVVALLVVIGTNSASASVAVARIGALFLSFLVFSDIATQALAWFDAAAKSNDVYLRLQAEDLSDEAAAMAVFGDYSVATATTPPIPTFLYKRRHDHIERAWQTATSPSASLGVIELPREIR
jgi:hypothetical protein